MYEYIKANGMAKVSEMAAHFNVSELTVRRDLDSLADEKIIERFRGGALIIDRSNHRSDVNILSYKHAIAMKGAEFVEDYDTIFINSSSTALLVLKYTKAKNITIITNNGNALFAERPNDSTLIFVGGEIKYPKTTMVGDIAMNSLERITAHKCFLGCAGISSEQGIMSSILQEATINERMISNTVGRKFILFNHKRIGRIQPFRTCKIEEVTDLITDNLAKNIILEEYRNKGTQIHIVKPIKKIT